MAGRKKKRIEVELERHFHLKQRVGELEDTILRATSGPDPFVTVRNDGKMSNLTYGKTKRLLSERLETLREQIGTLQQCIDTLQENKQTLIVLRYKHNTPVAQIANHFDVSERTYHRWRNQALQHIEEVKEEMFVAPTTEAAGAI